MSLLAAANAVIAGNKMANKGKECVQVVVRCRPFNKKEKAEGREGIIDIVPDNGQVTITNSMAAAASGAQGAADPESNRKHFTFDAVYDENSTQKGFYEESCYPLVESVMEGFNGTIFAYGQTGCGKTFTMQGADTPELRGVIPHSFDHIFEAIRVSKGVEFLVRCSYLEIYNEEIRDLLSKDPKAKCELKEDPSKGVYTYHAPSW